MPEHSEEIASLAAGSPDDAWEMAGGFGFTDEIAVKLDARWRELGGRTRAVPVSLVDLAWLIEGYARARQAVLSGSSEMAEQFEEIESLSWRCKDEGHEFLCRMAEGSCVRCIPQQAQSQQALTDQFAVGHQAVTRLGLYDLADWMRAAFFGSSEVQPIWQLGGRGQGGSA